MDPNERLLAAVEEGRVADADKLLSEGAIVNFRTEFGDSLLMIAAAHGNRFMLDMLIKNQAELDMYNVDRQTALHLATARGHAHCVKILINERAHLNIRNHQKNTPLMIAAQKGYYDIVRMFADAGADLNARGKHKNTALIYAASMGHDSVVQLLVDVGAALHLRGQTGNTALMYAVCCRQERCVRVLIKAGADVEALNVHMSSPVNAAHFRSIDAGTPEERQQFKDIRDMLIKAGGKPQPQPVPLFTPGRQKVFVNSKGEVSHNKHGPFQKVLTPHPLPHGEFNIKNQVQGKAGETIKVDVRGKHVEFKNPDERKGKARNDKADEIVKRKVIHWQCAYTGLVFEEAANPEESLPTDQKYERKGQLRYCNKRWMNEHKQIDFVM